MISAPRIRPAARPTSASRPETIFVTKPSATAGARLLGRRTGVVHRGRIEAELVGGDLTRRVDRGADLVPLVDHSPDGGDHHHGHQADQAEDDQAGGQGGLELAALELPDQRLEDHGQNGCEEQRKHDLAHGGQRGDHDDRRHHAPDEAPGPRADPGKRAVHHRSKVPDSRALDLMQTR